MSITYGIELIFGIRKDHLILKNINLCSIVDDQYSGHDTP